LFRSIGSRLEAAQFYAPHADKALDGTGETPGDRAVAALIPGRLYQETPVTFDPIAGMMHKV
jgi:hypothetical protein